MEKGFKECPYCKNEIKEGAIKCQFCKEFLKIEDDKEGKITEEIKKDSIETKELSVKKYGTRVRSKTWIWVLSIIGVLFLALLIYGWRDYKNNSVELDLDFFNDLSSELDSDYDIDYNYANYSLEKMKNHRKNIRSYDDIKEELNSHDGDEFKEMEEIIDDFYGKIQSIQGELYLDTANYKDKDIINQTINSRNSYADYFSGYSNDISALLKKYENKYNQGNGKYSFGGFSEEVKKLSNSVSEYRDLNVKFYKYILSIQNDFYVENDGQIYFYDGGSKMDKYNELSNELYVGAIKFVEDYNNYTDYMDEYNKYMGVK